MSLIFAPARLTSRFLGALIERLDDTWGLALAGEAGVAHMLKNLLAEVDLTLALTRHTAPSQLDRSALAPPRR